MFPVTVKPLDQRLQIGPRYAGGDAAGSAEEEAGGRTVLHQPFHLLPNAGRRAIEQGACDRDAGNDDQRVGWLVYCYWFCCTFKLIYHRTRLHCVHL